MLNSYCSRPFASLPSEWTDCKRSPHNATLLFSCPSHHTTLSKRDLWTFSVEVTRNISLPENDDDNNDLWMLQTITNISLMIHTIFTHHNPHWSASMECKHTGMNTPFKLIKYDVEWWQARVIVSAFIFSLFLMIDSSRSRLWILIIE